MEISNKTIEKYHKLITFVWESVQGGIPLNEALTQNIFREFHVAAFKKTLAQSICEAPNPPAKSDAHLLLRNMYKRAAHFAKLRNEKRKLATSPTTPHLPTTSPDLFTQNQNEYSPARASILAAIPDDALADEVLRRGDKLIAKIISQAWNSQQP